MSQQYQSPFATYHPDAINALSQGWDRGISMRRSIEETAKLVREREQQEEAQKLIKDAADEMQAAKDDMTYKQGHAESLLERSEDGHPVPEPDQKSAFRDFNKSAFGLIDRMYKMGERLAGSGNAMAMKHGMDMIQQSAVLATNLEAEAKRRQEAADAVAERGTRKDMNADDNATILEKTDRDNVAASERVDRSEEGANFRAQLSADTELQATGMRESGANYRTNREVGAREKHDRDDLAEQTRQFNALRSDRKSENNTPDKQFERTLKIAEGVASLEGLGWSDEQINKHLKGSKVEDFRARYSKMSEGIRTKLTKNEQYLKRLQERAENGENVKDQVTKAQANIKRLRREEDRLQDAEMRADEIGGDRSLANSIGRGFISFMGGVSKVLEAPEDAFLGAVEASVEGIESSRGNEVDIDIKGSATRKLGELFDSDNENTETSGRDTGRKSDVDF